MRINGKITEIITSRALVSFGGFVELEGKEFEDMKNIFTYLSKEYEFYCNHVVLKCVCFNSVFYIGFNDNKICIGTAVGVKIGNDTIIGLLVGVAWDENLQISELSLSPSENNVNTYLIDTYIMPYFDEYLNVVVYTAL